MLLCVCCSFSNAQSRFNVSGIVIDKNTRESVISATVRILSLPDSTMVTGVATDANGAFNIKNVKKGNYALKVTFIGYHENVIPLDLTKEKEKNKNVGYITLIDDTQLLKEAVVTANAAQVQVSGDSLVFNAAAIRTSEGSALEELVKKLPGAEIDEDGNIKINGKTVTKILVDGKEFFLNDKNMALKNIPTKIVDKIKAYDRKSDLARVTGIDDGEEETVLDLSIKKGMNQGWFGNLDLALGTERRYTEKLMLNRFTDTKQFTLIGSANNIGDRGFGGGGGRGWGRGGNGLEARKDLGFNFATTSEKLETGGNVRFRYVGADVANRSHTESFVTSRGAFTSSTSSNNTSNISANMDFRLEWKPDSMTNIIFRPSANYSRNRGYNSSLRATFNTAPDSLDTDPILYAIENIYNPDAIYDFIVNTNSSYQQSYSNSKGMNGELQINRRLNNEGRNITFRATGGLSNSESKQLSASDISYRTKSPNDNNRYYTTPGKSRNYSLQGTYSEPIAERTYLQFSYRFNYGYSESDRSAAVWADSRVCYDALSNALQVNRYNVAGALDQMLNEGYIPNSDKVTQSKADSLSQYSEYRNFNHTISLSFRKVTDKINFSAGFDLLPQHSTLDYKYMSKDYPVITRNVFNAAPRIDLRYQFNKQTQLRVNYWGRTTQPSMVNLLDITDDSDPLNITKGNPGLKSSFNHNIRANYNTYNADLQQGIFSFGGLNFTQNAISNRTWYDESTGVRTTRPENIDGNWNGYAGFGYNRGLGEKKYFTVNTFTALNFNHQVSYLDPQKYEEETSATNQLGVNQRLSFGFRKEWFEISINGNVNYNHTRNNIVTNSNLDTWNFSYGAEMNLNFNNGISFSTDISQSSRRGYSTSSMNTNELLWNAKLSKSFLKGNALTISAEWNDILQKRSNISRTITAMQSSDTEYNSIYSYGMLHIIYKLNIFGGKNAHGTENAQKAENFRMGGNRGGGGGPRR